MNRLSRSALSMLICFSLLFISQRTVNQAFGAQKTTKERVSAAVAVKDIDTASKKTKPARKIASTTKGRRLGEPTLGSVRQDTEGIKPTPSKIRAKISHKKALPKVTLQPRTDLIHYGILEDSQRYDPRPRSDSASVQSPQTLDLTHDHFQELDRNQDGIIDPVERAFGRIDMDRDLHTRTLR